jgi:uncharacterized protein
MIRIWRLFLLLLLAAATPAAAQKFPPLTGRVVDTAGLLTPAQQQALSQKLEALEKASTRQLVVATVPDLQGYAIEDYGYKLGRAWGIGQKGANNGALLLVAKNDRKVRIEAGYGLEPILTDAFNKDVIDEKIVPAFKAGDYPGGINAGVDALIQQLQAPQEEAEKRAAAASGKVRQAEQGRHRSHSFFPLIFWGVIIFFFILPTFRKRRKTYGRRYGGMPGVFLWGSGLGGGGGWGSGGGGGWGGGGGGFSGGGGSFGGGGASGSW